MMTNPPNSATEDSGRRAPDDQGAAEAQDSSEGQAAADGQGVVEELGAVKEQDAVGEQGTHSGQNDFEAGGASENQSDLSYQSDSIRSQPRAARYFPSLRERDKGSSFMFVQDVSLGIAPYRRSHEGMELRVDCIEEDKARLMKVLSSLGRYERYNLNGAVEGAIQEIATHVSWSGKAFYEIVRTGTNAVVLLNFTSERLFDCYFFLVQVVPRKDRELYDNRRFVFLRKRRVWAVSIPAELGGSREYSRILRRLARYGLVAPRFWQSDPTKDWLGVSYNVTEYHRNKAIYETWSTNRWGWNRRDGSQNYWTEYMYFHRSLAFRKSQAVLREHIVQQLNSLFGFLGIRATISLSGKLNSKELAEVATELRDGRINFKNALDRMYF
jgi:hypothetical protein